jgi:hypothetical protein
MITKIDINQLTEDQQDELFNEYSILFLLLHCKLTAPFCKKYIINKKYEDQPEYNIYDVLKYQPHITLQNLTLN